jgi:hypothetical protein
MESVSPMVTPRSFPEGDPKKLIRYWSRCLWEAMLRNPKVTGEAMVESNWIQAGSYHSAWLTI